MKRRHFFLLLAIMAMTGMLKGQSKDDFSGVWYIANETNHASTNYATHWYLVPGADPQQPHYADAYFHNEYCNKSGKGDYTGDNYGDPAKQFLTTYQTNRDLNSIWIIVSTDDDYYNIIHALTGRYVVYEPPYKDATHRKSMHLESTTTPGDKHKFTITGSLDGAINISPKGFTSGNRYFNPAVGVGNRLQYYGTGDYFHEGMIGLYSGSGDKSQWYFENASSATELTPVISDVDPLTNTFTITSPAAAYSTIRFTTDGSTTPNASTGNTATSGIDIDITDNWDVLAVGVFGTFVTPVAGPKSLNPTKCATPVISFDYTTLKVSITCATSNTTIYYTTDGDTPTTGSTEYSVPFSVTGTTTVKAIATHANIPNSEVAELAITQVATPTIQNNGSNAISITSATPDATIYYTIDGSNPTTSSTEYITPLQENVSGVTIKAIAVKADMITSAVGSGSVTLQCEAPVIIRSSNTSFTVTCPFPTSGVTIYYTTNGSAPSTSSSSIASGGTVTCTLPVTVKAFATATNYDNSTVTTTYLTQGMGGDGSAANPYTIENQSEVADFVIKANTPSEASKHYKVIATGTLDFSGAGNITQTFSGTFDGGTCVLTGLSHPLFNIVNGGVVKNVTLKSVDISSSADTVGAIACKAMGYSRIYNCGILPNTNDFPDGTHPAVTTSGKCAGGLVGSLRDNSRVINCYSYADVSASTTISGTTASGIVGYNTFKSTAEETGGRYTKLRTAIVNCMFYGDIKGGTNQYGVYGGELITNASTTGISNYNYFRNGSVFTATNGHPNTSGGSNVVGNPTDYNCSFPAEERYLTQVEFHRSLLNSNRELCGWWVSSDDAPSTLTTAQVQAIPKDASLIYKWVVDPNIAPYPILKPFGKYPSVVNGNTGEPWFDRTTAEPYQGKQLGTLTVNVTSGSHHTTGTTQKTLTLPITDMDTLHYDFGYRKVQLPYYNTVFGNPESADWNVKYADNYTASVVTGWMVTYVDHEGDSTFKAAWEDGYNFAERKCTDKDLFGTSGRVFAQGGNYYVPDDVTEITIEAYWGKAIYVRNDQDSYDRVNITLANTGSHFAPAGTRGDNINGATVYTSIRSALATIDAKKTVYDYALVLVGNVQESVGLNDIKYSASDYRGFTIMSVDLDFDEEPDYCLEWQLGAEMKRQIISPIRFDFLPVVELGIAGKLHNSTNFFSLGCYRSQGHFEVTETSFIRFGQFEFELETRDVGPIILNGGIYDQYCRGRNKETNQHINYVILGGHVVMPSFTPGAHVAASYQTRHCAVNALGGDFSSFYLTGGYREDVTPYNDNPHCYIDGGRFGTVAAAFKEGIKGNVTWRINHALIREFYGGGVMADDNKIVKGNIDVVINNSIVGKYCGGPKFGDMVSGKTVTTSATGTTFNQFFGAGNGGTNYMQYASTDDSQHGPLAPGTWASTINTNYHPGQYRSTAQGYEADYDIEVINTSTGDLAGRVINRSYYYSAQFATTNTGNVTSTLTNCTVNNNFYGAGFLGGVTGNVTSTLTDCTVLGSAFGAGYSAASGTVTIHNITKNPPVANIYTGMITYNPGGTSTPYTWTNIPGSTSSPVVQDTLFFTEISLVNLGAVSSNVTLNLKGNTKVGTDIGGGVPKANTGNVFGGGDQSAVNGNTTVNIQEGTTILGNVYGGGNEGPVGGNSEVKIQDD